MFIFSLNSACNCRIFKKKLSRWEEELEYGKSVKKAEDNFCIA